MPNDQDEPRVPLARSPASAGGVTAVLVGSGAWFGSVFIVWNRDYSIVLGGNMADRITTIMIVAIPIPAMTRKV